MLISAEGSTRNSVGCLPRRAQLALAVAAGTDIGTKCVTYAKPTRPAAEAANL